MVTETSSPCPLTTALTAPPPAVPSTVSALELGLDAGHLGLHLLGHLGQVPVAHVACLRCSSRPRPRRPGRPPKTRRAWVDQIVTSRACGPRSRPGSAMSSTLVATQRTATGRPRTSPIPSSSIAPLALGDVAQEGLALREAEDDRSRRCTSTGRQALISGRLAGLRPIALDDLRPGRDSTAAKRIVRRRQLTGAGAGWPRSAGGSSSSA